MFHHLQGWHLQMILKYTILINIDEPDPSNYYGGQIATVVGKQVFNDIFNYLSLKSDASSEEIGKSLLKGYYCT